MNLNELPLRNSECGTRNAEHRRRLEILSRHLAEAEAEGRAGSPFPIKERHPLSRKKAGAPVVIGGMVLDIQAFPASHEIRPGTTTPGKVRYVRGGVGRNVAECLARLDSAPFLISVVGGDMAGDSLLDHWSSLGLSVEGIRKCDGTSTPVVSAVFDNAGELAVAVADTQPIEVHLTPEWIERFAKQIKAAPIVLLDANLHPLALRAACKLADGAGVPIWFEPVSVVKSKRATDLLKLITFVSPNEAELVAMAEALDQKTKKTKTGSLDLQDTLMADGIDVKTVSEKLDLYLKGPIKSILKAGVKFIVLTLGGQGAVLCSQSSSGKIVCHHYPALPASVVKVSGAGDCLAAGMMAAIARNVEEKQALAHGVAAAKLAVECSTNVPLTLVWTEVADSAKAVSVQERTLEAFC